MEAAIRTAESDRWASYLLRNRQEEAAEEEGEPHHPMGRPPHRQLAMAELRRRRAKVRMMDGVASSRTSKGKELTRDPQDRLVPLADLPWPWG